MAQALNKTRFRDIAEREIKAREILDDRLRKFESIENKDNRTLSADEKAEKKLIKAILAEIENSQSERFPEVCDPLFVGARQLFKEEGMLSKPLMSHEEGVLLFRRKVVNREIVLTALTLGLLCADSVDSPPVKIAQEKTRKGGGTGIPDDDGDDDEKSIIELGHEEDEKLAMSDDGEKEKTIVSDTNHLFWKHLTRAFYNAIGEAREIEDLAVMVLPILAVEGDSDGYRRTYVPNVRVEEFARIMRELVKRGVTKTEIQLRRRVNEALDRVQLVGVEGPIEEKGIDLPDLDEVTDNDIIAENVRLMGPMIVSAMFDELKAFQVVDHLVERFQRGTLSIVSSEAGKLLYRYWREAPNRISEMERRTFYATTLGVPGGEAGEFINRNFNDLWLRFVSSVSEFVRQGEVDKLLRAGIPSPVSHQQVRKAARDLASNLSLHGYGMAYYAAVELQEQIKFMIQLLGDKDIRGNFGARDMWQVIDQVATLELGGAKTSSRYRTLATCGTIITAWLAQNAPEIMSASGPLLDITEIRHPPARISGQKASTHPNDYDLVNACELWLADTGTADSRVEQLSQPYEAPTQTSRPVEVPSVVQDMLSGMGDLGVGFGKTN